MNKVSRTITGVVVMVLSISLIFFEGLFNEQGIDYVSIVVGIFFFCLGLAIFFNKKEDEIEKIKKKKENIK